MNVTIRQVTSLEKVRKEDSLDLREIHSKTALAGERFSYQLCIRADKMLVADVDVDSPLAEHIKLYRVRDAVMDLPADAEAAHDDYITFTPGLMPDILVPLEESKHSLMLDTAPCSIWVRVDIPRDMQSGVYPIRVKLTVKEPNGEVAQTFEQVMSLEVIPAVMPEQRLIYTRWIYLDCIAVAHGVEIYSEQHWSLIDKYIAAAADIGVNMILVPVHTPPLDTEVGTARPCVQLIDIERLGDTYHFSFDKFRRYISICKSHGIRYFEIAHMFSQWGAKFAPNIMVTENGRTDYMFGWHVAADSPEYVDFLKQYISAIAQELDAQGISENTYFHISDEPELDALEAYKAAADIIRPLISRSKSLDAISNYAFYEKGLVECPVTAIDRLHEFLDHDIPNQWTYYCCVPKTVYPNSFMAMPSYRVRILGFLLYKFGIKGFLHWGFNFYNASRSTYPIDPYLTTSGDKSYPSGDPFVVYPSEDGVYPSIRGEVTYEAVQDMGICFALEKQIGRDAVVAMIDAAAQRDMRFDDYPRNKEFTENLREQMIRKLRDMIGCIMR